MIEKVEYRGWENNVRISNDDVEVIVTLDVGPRVICYRKPGGFNVLKNYDEHMGKAGEEEWQIRGGLRFWIAPEDLTRTYFPDNRPVKHEQIGPRTVCFTPPIEDEYGIQKEMTIGLAASGSRVEVSLKVTNIGPLETMLAPWAPTVMAPGGIEIIPQPPHRNHPLHPKNAKSPADFAPTQELILWPYFDFTDSRWTFGSKYIFLRQDAKKGPTKIGLAHRMGWVAYLNQGNLFVKNIGYVEGATYPDMGTSYQTFTNEDMLEMETVGVLTRLAPGQSAELSESWNLHIDVPDVRTESDVDKHIVPLV
ncbi:MAG: hypothetical protein K8T89_15160 [Planctomycetes bacterium]|nr:hypothetical protein [Planctomycetota bacterium]